MKRSRFSEQQIAFILKQTQDGASVEEVCQKVGIDPDLSPMAQQIRGLDALRDETAEGA